MRFRRANYRTVAKPNGKTREPKTQSTYRRRWYWIQTFYFNPSQKERQKSLNSRNPRS
ncbi:hypothetical protein ANO14919_111750 [Xylariales sp. No.14919]|nr:hypothetical protein ANO14919_111750 [Xylariales sp. No.14919]